MPKYESALENLVNRLNVIEELIHENARLLSESLAIGREHHFLITNGLNGYKDRIASEAKSSPKDALYAKIRLDKTLRHPHRKIMDYLVDLYESQTGFAEANFSRIVKECRLGKNKAKEYLEFLVERGYLIRRDDGYRVWYRVDEGTKSSL